MPLDLKQFIRDVPDFPKPGIIFKDIAPLLGHGPAFRQAIDRLVSICEEHRLRPDLCAGPEARGFLFGAALADRLGTGLVMVDETGARVVIVNYDETHVDRLADVVIHADVVDVLPRLAAPF